MGGGFNLRDFEKGEKWCDAGIATLRKLGRTIEKYKEKEK
jgi:hypothetical protein